MVVLTLGVGSGLVVPFVRANNDGKDLGCGQDASARAGPFEAQGKQAPPLQVVGASREGKTGGKIGRNHREAERVQRARLWTRKSLQIWRINA